MLIDINDEELALKFRDLAKDYDLTLEKVTKFTEQAYKVAKEGGFHYSNIVECKFFNIEKAEEMFKKMKFDFSYKKTNLMMTDYYNITISWGEPKLWL